jgi:hypothetical protein
VDNGVGPLRIWPGGLCLSRAIGDFDVGDSVIPFPHVTQVRPLALAAPQPLPRRCGAAARLRSGTAA